VPVQRDQFTVHRQGRTQLRLADTVLQGRQQFGVAFGHHINTARAPLHHRLHFPNDLAGNTRRRLLLRHDPKVTTGHPSPLPKGHKTRCTP
jgi:hypothetical protein